MSNSIRLHSKLLSAIGAAVLAAGFAFSSAPAQAADVDFEGKKVTFYTPHKGADSVLSLQTWSKYISKYLPGNPEITVKSRSGGGGVTNANQFEQSAKPDGLTVSMHNDPVMVSFAIKRKGVSYDPTQWEIFGASSSNYIGIAGKASGLDSAADMESVTETLTFGTRTRNFITMSSELLWEALGKPVKVTPGFDSDSSMAQSLGSGELDLAYVNQLAFMNQKDSYESLDIKGLYQLGTLSSEGTLVRHPSLPDLPTTWELFHKFNPDGAGSDQEKGIFLGAAIYQLNKGYFLPKGTAPEIVEAWRVAADKAANDPEFQAEHQKLFGLPLDYMPAAQAEELLNSTLATLSTPFFQSGGLGYQMAVGK